MILNTRPQNGSFGSGFRVIVVGVFAAGSRPCTGGTSAGLGRYQATASSTGCTPMQSSAEPARIGTTRRSIVACRIAFRISSGGIGASFIASSALSSEKSKSVDTSCSR